MPVSAHSWLFFFLAHRLPIMCLAFEILPLNLATQANLSHSWLFFSWPIDDPLCVWPLRYYLKPRYLGPFSPQLASFFFFLANR
jgi:hypothetical protein